MIHHLGASNFWRGIDPFRHNTELRNVFLHVSGIDDITAQLLLTETYDKVYGIFNHDAVNLPKDDGTIYNPDPMAVQGMHPAEDPVSHSSAILLMRELMVSKLPEITQTPIMEMMNWPRYVLDSLLDEHRKAMKAARVKEKEEEDKHRVAMAQSQQNQ